MKPHFYRLAAHLALAGAVALAATPFAGQVAPQSFKSRLPVSSSRQFFPSQDVFFGGGRAAESIAAVVENPGGVACSKGFALVTARVSGASLDYNVFLAVSREQNPDISELAMRPIVEAEYSDSGYGPSTGTSFVIRPGMLKPGEYFATVFAKKKASGTDDGLMSASVPLAVNPCLPDRPAEVLLESGYMLEKKPDSIELVASGTSRNRVQIADVSIYAGSRQLYVNRVLFINRLLIDKSYYQNFLVPHKTIEFVIGKTRLSAFID